ncbi:MAG: hypothetical protein NT067_07440 [Candidatus Diapherotrites archaeon]|nr:hypothetical protein [Candidatus Diapherotrites archaeon]
MNERAFNLFTALLALILIVLTSILVSSMVQSESNAKTIIAKVLSQSRLESMSRLIRADAFQTFNYATREQMELWLSEPGNVFEIADYHKWADWQSVVDEFADAKFKNAEVFADYLARNLPSMIAQSKPEGYAGYELDVQFDQVKFKAILKEVLAKSYEDNDFFQIIDCKGTPETCPNGSFYLNLKFSKLDQSLYEQMPLITVKDTRGNSTGSDPIIPKNDLKVYIPTRIFKALTLARSFMHSELGSGINTASDFGYYSPRIQNEIDSMALGFCDYGYCYPRQNPYFPPDRTYIDSQSCPGFITSSSDYLSVDGTFRGTNFSYEAGNDKGTEDEIKALLKQRLCELSTELLGKYEGPQYKNDFAIATETFQGKPCYVTVDEKGGIEAKSHESKGIEAGNADIDASGLRGTFSEEEPNNPDGPGALCPYQYELQENQRTGMFREGGEIKINDFGPASCFAASAPDKAKCTQVTVVKLMVTYMEKDMNYKVMKDRDVWIKISTADYNYTPFNAKISLGDTGSDCAFSFPEFDEKACNEKGWVCYVPNTVDGCYPSKLA